MLSFVHAAPDFTITASPTILNFNNGSSGTSTITLNSTGGFAGNVNLTVSVSPAGLSCSVIPTSVALSTTATATLVCTGSTVGTYAVIVTATSLTLSHSVVVTVNVQDFTITSNPSVMTTTVNVQGTSTISVTALNGFTGTVSLTVSTNPSGPSCSFNPTSVTLPPTPSTTTLSCTASLVGNYTVSVTGTSGSLTRTASLTLKAADFKISSSPLSIIVNSGDAGTSTITLTSLNGYSGTILLSVSTSPTSLVCTLSPASVALTSIATSMLSCMDNAGTYTVTVTATSGGVAHSVIGTVTVQDFTISTVPGLTVNAGANGNALVTVGSVNDFTGRVTLATTATPSGLICTVSPSVVDLVQSATSNLSCHGIAGVYTVTVTGTNNLLVHSTSITYTVQDVVIVAATTGLTAAPGSSMSTTIIVVGLDGYTGPVTLTMNITPPNGLTCSLTPTSMIMGTFGTSTLSCNGNPGTYQVNVTATSGTLSHHASINYSIESTGVANQPLSLSSFMLLAGMIGGGLATGLVFKRLNTKTAPFDDFYNFAGGELPSPATLLILGDAGTGTTTLGLELLQHDLGKGKHCGLLTYDCFPSEIIMKFRSLGYDVSKHLQNGTFKIVDCYSALIGDEKAPIKDPIDFTEISIQVTQIIEKAGNGPVTLLLDSINPIFNGAAPNTVINFLRVLGAKVKNAGGLFIITGTNSSMTEDVTSKVEAVVDAVIELSVARKGKGMMRMLSFKKMAGHHYSSVPVEFTVVTGKGILFKKHRFSLQRHHNHVSLAIGKPIDATAQSPNPVESLNNPDTKPSGPEDLETGKTDPD